MIRQIEKKTERRKDRKINGQFSGARQVVKGHSDHLFCFNYCLSSFSNLVCVGFRDHKFNATCFWEKSSNLAIIPTTNQSGTYKILVNIMILSISIFKKLTPNIFKFTTLYCIIFPRFYSHSIFESQYQIFFMRSETRRMLCLTCGRHQRTKAF